MTEHIIPNLLSPELQLKSSRQGGHEKKKDNPEFVEKKPQRKRGHNNETTSKKPTRALRRATGQRSNRNGFRS